MKLLIKHSYLLVITLFFYNCGSTNRQELLNLDDAKVLVQNYYESGTFDAECKEIIDSAISQIEKLTLRDTSAVIFDIDETALSNYNHTKEIGFGYKYELWSEWLKRADADAIKQTKRFYDWLISKKIKVIFLTGRTENERKATVKNLHLRGYTNYDTLIVRNSGEIKIPAAEFKAIKRKELVNKGYKIIANIGDQWSDLVGGNSGVKIKLPNYLYIID